MNVSGTKRRSRGPANVVGQPLGVGLDLGHLGHRRSAQAYSVRSRTSENTASRAPNTGCGVEQPLLVAEQPDVAVDERLLGVEPPVATATAVSHVCSMRTCSGSAGAGTEAGGAAADLEVVGHVALGTVRRRPG